MLNKKKRIFLILAFFLFSQKSTAQECKPEGVELGSYKGVPAHSCGLPNGGNLNTTHQCVKYVEEFYLSVYKYKISFGGVNAAAYFNEGPKYIFTALPNGGAVAPEPDDILCYGGGVGGYGHVAIVKEVGSDYIVVIEENVSCTSAFRTIKITVSNGRYTVSTMNGYILQGWLRFSVGLFYGGVRDATLTYKFRAAYDAYGGFAVLGYPHDNGAMVWVHDWNGVWIQDFKNKSNGVIYHLVFNKYQFYVFLVHGSIASFWFNNFGALGNALPISDEKEFLYGGHDTDFIKRGTNCVMQKFGTRSTDGHQKTLVWNGSSTQHFPCGEFETQVLLGGYCAEFFSFNNIVKLPFIGRPDGLKTWLCAEGIYNFWVFNSANQGVAGLTQRVLEGNDQVWSPNYPTTIEPISPGNTLPSQPSAPEAPADLSAPPVIKLNALGFDFDVQYNEADLQISNTGGQTLSWSLSKSNGDWFVWSSGNGDLIGGEFTVIQIVPDRSKLSAGRHEGSLTVSSNGGNKTIDIRIKIEQTVDPIDPNAEPANLSGSCTYQNNRIAFNGTFFDRYNTLFIQCTDGRVIKTGVNSGMSIENQTEYSGINFAFGTDGTEKYYPGRGGCQLTVSGLEWQSAGWYKILSNVTPTNPALSVSQANLDFGTDKTQLTFSINNSQSGTCFGSA